MKKMFFSGIFGIAIFSLALIASPAWAAPFWELKAPSDITFVCGGGNYYHQLNIVDQNSNGDFSGKGEYKSNPSYTWDITGNIDGNSIKFKVVYTGTNPGYTLNATGSIAENGSISGITDGNCKTFSMPAGSAENIDGDEDGVLNKNDFCLDTDEEVWPENWGTHRWHYNGAEFVQQQNKKNNGTKKPKPISYTYGCSCKQILDVLKNAGLGEFGGHYKYGCSTSILDDFHNNLTGGDYDGRYFIESVNIPANKYTETSSSSLVNGINYIFKASGTWINSQNVADTEYASKDGWATHFDGYDVAPWFLGQSEFDLEIDGNFVDWGAYNTSHVYERTYTGTGSPAKFLIFDGDSDDGPDAINTSWYGDNSGSLNVDIYAEL